jgi:uncharacterized protein YbcI
MMPSMGRREDIPPQASGRRLVEVGDGVAELPEGSGTLRADIANAMVGMKKQFYGKGPTKAKAYILDDYVFVVLEGGLTRNEETLLAAGQEDVVRNYRLTFQAAMTSTITTAIQELVGRRVLDYHSQIVFNPPRTFEILVLEPVGDG